MTSPSDPTTSPSAPVTTRDTIVRNTYWYGVVTAAGLVAGLLMSVILARGLGPARMGDYSYLLWLLRTMTALATLGFALGTLRYTADALGQRRPAVAAGFLRLFVRWQIVATALVVVGLVPLVAWLAPADFRWPLAVILLGLFPMTLEAVYSNAAYGAQRYDVTTQVSGVKMTLHLLTAALALALGADILGLTVAGIGTFALSSELLRRRVRALYPDRPAPIAEAERRELRGYVLPLSIVAVLDALVWDRSEIFFLRLYVPSAEIAFYSLAFGLANRAMLAPQILIGPMFPALAALHGRGDRAEFTTVYRSALRSVALVGVPLIVIGTAMAPGLITLLYGAEYLPVAGLLAPMLLVGLVAVLRQVAWSALRASGDRRWALHATWVAAAVNVGAALLLIPTLGTWGALVANASAQLLASAVAFVGVRVRCGCTFPVFDLLRVVTAGVAGFGVTAIAARGSHGPLGLAAAGLAGAVAFLATAAFAGVVTGREWAVVALPLRTLPRWLRQGAPAAAALGALAVLYAPVMVNLVRVWSDVPYYTYGFLVPAFSAWALWDARGRLAGARPVWDVRGLAVVVVGVTMLAVGQAMASLTLRGVSLPVVLAGAAVFVLGVRRVRPLAFGIGFLALMAPLPDGVLETVSYPLQALAAWFTEQTLWLAGVPSVRRGLSLHMPAVIMHVTEACNGLRFLLAMLVLGAAFAWATQSRLSRQAAVVGLAVAVGVAANLVRVAGTGLLAYYYGVEAAQGFFHIAYGKAVYAVMLLPFVVAVFMLRSTPEASDAGHGA